MKSPSSRLCSLLPTLLVLAVSVGAAACDRGTSGGGGSSEAPHPSRGTGRHIREIEASARPSGEPAQTYGVAREHALTPIEAELLSQAEAAFGGSLTHDPSLSAMVRDLAVTSPSRFDMPPTLLDALMAWHGVADPQPAVIVVELAGREHGCDREPLPDCAGAVAAIIEEVSRTLETQPQARWRVGVGVAAVDGGSKTRMMVGVVERGIELAPIPVTVAAGGEVRVDGRLLGARRAPRIERVDPRGHWARLPAVVGSDGSIQSDVPCDGGDGIYQVELLADGRLGPEVVANLRVFCGVERPSEVVFVYERLGPKVTAADVVRGNFDLLNEARAARGLPALAWDDRAAAVAAAHSADMAQNGFVGHVSPTSGDATARFEHAGIVGVVVRENVARGYGPKGVHESLMNSPGHRANLLAEDVSHVGIGVVFGEPESSAADAPRPVFLTQNFYAKPGADAPEKPGPALVEGVDALRAEAGVGALSWDAGLTKLAQQRADASVGVGPAVDDQDFREAIASLGFSSLEQHQVSGGRFDMLLTLELWRELPAGAKVGVGISRAKEQFVLVILVGG
ncbi:hypothetical protein G6O69_25985 [Pseudenhygromyxa sp. WMMC2535]|uniref:CAP domain-containing protein n=1 Tax=Pseudenhygromyxa sp. WMMC2535 TaxID=2712867 RepID=UPI001553A3EA|nr:CAP domain-containing protein [Pseudenhygromyxa sp. WMMC2535]NVB41315.1 hypothetical protein [Pseudenhygromyxa sp. WMMC2535]